MEPRTPCLVAMLIPTSPTRQNYVVKYQTKSNLHILFINILFDYISADALNKFANEYWHFVDKVTRQPGMEAFMKKYIENVNAFLMKLSIEDLSNGEFNRPLAALKLN